MRRCCLWIALAACFFTPHADTQVIVGSAQKADNFGQNVYGIGIAGGAATGLGVSFRTHFPSRLSAQAVAGIIKDSQTLSSSLGFQLQYDLVRGRSTRFYAGGGMSYFYSGSGSNSLEAPIRFGIGIGGEFNIQDALSGSIEGTFTFFNDGVIVPLPQLSLHYYFY
jgi:hypothetical protein